MTIDELRNGIARAKAEILASLEVEGARVGADAAALVEDRIVTKGEKNTGGNLSPYSTKPVPAFLYFGRSPNQAGDKAVRDRAKKREGVSYREFRALNGLNVSPKNLQFTGEMWQGFGVIGVRKIGEGIVEVEIGGKNPRSSLLLAAHSDRENTRITAPSDRELALIKTGIEQRLKAIIQRNLS
jgi:hypothetical protein